MMRQREAGRPLLLVVFAASLLSLGLVQSGCGDDPSLPDPETASVCEAVEGDAPEGTLRIQGEVIPLKALGAAGSPGSLQGFVLAADGCSVFVDAADRSQVVGIGGENLAVVGEVATLDKVDAGRLRHALDLSKGTEMIEDRVPSPVAIGTGGRYVDAYSIVGESPGQ